MVRVSNVFHPTENFQTLSYIRHTTWAESFSRPSLKYLYEAVLKKQMSIPGGSDSRGFGGGSRGRGRVLALSWPFFLFRIPGHVGAWHDGGLDHVVTVEPEDEHEGESGGVVSDHLLDDAAMLVST
jgi:hypothetical protein